MSILRILILLTLGIVFQPSWGLDAARARAQEPIRFMMTPHVHGDLIAFSYQGDIWIVERDGTGARRLTNHLARDVSPRFSPDGRWIAFTSDRFGNDDVFLVGVDGGEPRQITFHTTGDNVEGWTRDGRIMFATSRGSHPFYSPMYTVSPEGDLPVPMDMDQARNAAESPDGRYLFFNRIGLSTSRKGQKGNRTTDIWVLDRETGGFTKLTDRVTDPETESFRDHVHDAIPM
jgi:tricorn protease